MQSHSRRLVAEINCLFRNVCTFESLLRVGPSLGQHLFTYLFVLHVPTKIGSTITFGQMVFITLQYLPSFLLWDKKLSLPRLAHRQVPLREWLLQVIVLISGNLLNNWAFAYHVPLTLQIVFRSSGMVCSHTVSVIVTSSFSNQVFRSQCFWGEFY